MLAPDVPKVLLNLVGAELITAHLQDPWLHVEHDGVDELGVLQNFLWTLLAYDLGFL